MVVIEVRMEGFGYIRGFITIDRDHDNKSLVNCETDLPIMPKRSIYRPQNKCNGNFEPVTLTALIEQLWSYNFATINNICLFLTSSSISDELWNIYSIYELETMVCYYQERENWRNNWPIKSDLNCHLVKWDWFVIGANWRSNIVFSAIYYIPWCLCRRWAPTSIGCSGMDKTL